MKQVSTARCFGGEQAVYSHASKTTGTEMKISVFTAANGCPWRWTISDIVLVIGADLYGRKLHHQIRISARRVGTWLDGRWPGHVSARGGRAG